VQMCYIAGPLFFWGLIKNLYGGRSLKKLIKKIKEEPNIFYNLSLLKNNLKDPTKVARF
jgi:hypothetical protein